mgnify:CR=1 FL=1
MLEDPILLDEVSRLKAIVQKLLLLSLAGCTGIDVVMILRDKLKKPLSLGFLDFSTLEARRHFESALAIARELGHARHHHDGGRQRRRDRAGENVAVLHVGQLMGDDALEFFFVEDAQDALGGRDDGVLRTATRPLGAGERGLALDEGVEDVREQRGIDAPQAHVVPHPAVAASQERARVARIDEHGDVRGLRRQGLELQMDLVVGDVPVGVRSPAAVVRHDGAVHAADLAAKTFNGAVQSPAPSGPAIPPRDLYQQAYSDFARKNYDLSIQGFQEYLRLYRDTDLADNARRLLRA